MQKKKKYLSIILIIVILLTTGCGSNNYIKDDKGKIVTNEKTGQSLQKNIYCKPSEGDETYNLYEKYEDQMDIKLSKLPSCDEFKLNSNKTNSLWQFLFVKPLAYIILKVGSLFKNIGLTNSYLGISVMLIGLLIRLILLPFSIKNQKQSENIKKATPEIQKLEKKYANDSSNEAMLLKQQEMMAIYKKYKVNPTTSCLLSLIQLPVFFAFLEAIYKIPTIYEGKIFGWNLGTTPSIGIFKNHQYSFLILVVLIILSTYFSFKLTMKQSANANSAIPGAEKQSKMMLIFMTVFIGFASFSLPTAIALYWVVTYSFMFLQSYVIKLLQKHDEKKSVKKVKTIKEKLKIKEGLKYGKNK
ncbi:MAG: YidC/Oxa1 family membrane protein insertase [bacterium]|nr:YidC/Oxa1 family membrane protein insertase [bacterium]